MSLLKYQFKLYSPYNIEAFRMKVHPSEFLRMLVVIINIDSNNGLVPSGI